MVKGNITNPEVYIVFHYPEFVFAIFPSARTVTSKSRVARTPLSIQRIINVVMPKPLAVERY